MKSVSASAGIGAAMLALLVACGDAEAPAAANSTSSGTSTAGIADEQLAPVSSPGAENVVPTADFPAAPTTTAVAMPASPATPDASANTSAEPPAGNASSPVAGAATGASDAAPAARDVTAQAADGTVTTKSGVVTHGAITTTKDTIGWLLTCPVSHSLPDDPIVAPGHEGHAHMHDFTGNASTSAGSTYESMTAAANEASQATYNASEVRAGTSCHLPQFTPGTAGDTAAYWRPALYVDGQRVIPTVKDQLYYRAKPTFGTDFKAIPADARLIVGNANATSVETNPALVDGHIYFECSGKKYTTVPNCSSFLMNVVFPSCWDGQPMDHASPNGTDNHHFAYAVSGQCPAGFSVKVAQLSEKFKYNNVPSGVREFASMTATGRAPTYTAHADFWNTWNQKALEYLTDKCLNAQLSCGTNPITPLQ